MVWKSMALGYPSPIIKIQRPERLSNLTLVTVVETYKDTEGVVLCHWK